MPGTVKVLAHFVAKPGCEAALEALVRGLLEPTRAEAGCVMYRLWRQRENPAAFTLVEEWASDAALDRHLAMPHLERAKAALPALLAEPLQVIRHAEV